MKTLKTYLFVFASILIFVLLTACNSPSDTENETSSDVSTDTIEQTTQITTTIPITTEIEPEVTKTPMFIYDSEYSSYFPKAAEPEGIYVVSAQSTEANSLTLVSLQGLFAKSGTEQIIVNYNAEANNYINIIKKNYDCKVYNSTMILLIKNNIDKLDGYILTDLNDESINVATSLSPLLNALIVTTDNEKGISNLGLTKLLDVSDKNDEWLRSSEYLQKLNKDLAFMVSNSNKTDLRDYAIMTSSYVFSDSVSDTDTLKSKVNFMNDGFIILGWNTACGEYNTVKALSELNGSIIAADYAKNLAGLSGFNLSSANQKTEFTGVESEKHHTVCFVLSDGDNLQWTLNDYSTSSKWYGSELRGDFYMGWGLPAGLIDMAPPCLQYYYRNMTEKDEFILQLSGIGYTFPSHWKNLNALLKMQTALGNLTERSDMSVLEILDDVKLTQSVVDRYYSGFTKQDSINGVLYIDYSNYSGYNGKVFWSNNKPIVTAKYRIWDSVSSASNIATSINRASTDPTSANSYSFVIVHAWSGLGSDGNSIIANANTMDAIAAVISKLDSDVDVVTPSEFIRRITENVEH